MRWSTVSAATVGDRRLEKWPARLESLIALASVIGTCLAESGAAAVIVDRMLAPDRTAPSTRGIGGQFVRVGDSGFL